MPSFQASSSSLLPPWLPRAAAALLAAPAIAFAVASIFAAAVMPYRLWDSLAFGSWSRSIAEGRGLWTDAPALFLQRPLFYVVQGLLWRVDDDEWVGRLWSLAFAATLVAAVWLLARALTEDPHGRPFLPTFAAALVLASSVFATYALAGMSDVPVAALVAATGAALWRNRLTLAGTALVAALAAGAVLAKPTAPLGLAGLAAGVLLLRGRPALRGVAGLAIGCAVALAYDRWQAARLDMGFVDFVTAGNDEFWRARGEAARWDALARAEWLGAGLRLVVLLGLVHAVARVAGARPRVALGAAAGGALGWSLVGPLLADGGTPYPFEGGALDIVAWLVLVAALVAAPFYAERDPFSRRTYAALLVWLAPTALAWGWQRADEVRHLAPAWAPLVLLSAGALVVVSLALAHLRPAAALVPALALALLMAANLVQIDGLGREGWRGLLDLGPSGWSDRAEMENYAYGPFVYELNLARENVGPEDRIVSSNGRLAYFFPGRVETRYARTCGELGTARFFSYLVSGESAELAAREQQPTDPLGWIQCAAPTLTLVGEQQGIFAAFVVGDGPARPPLPEDCRITSTPGELLDAVFGDGLAYADAKALRERAEASGFTGVAIERTGCSSFRVVVRGVPEDADVQDELRREIESVGLTVSFTDAVRYPEVAADVAAVS